MKSIDFKVLRSGEHVICDNVKAIQIIDGIEYLLVKRPSTDRYFLMRKDALSKFTVDNRAKAM
jgi:hypothetical protein